MNFKQIERAGVWPESHGKINRSANLSERRLLETPNLYRLQINITGLKLNDHHPSYLTKKWDEYGRVAQLVNSLVYGIIILYRL